MEPERPQIRIWSISIACWVPKGTNTHPSYVIAFHYNNCCPNATQYYVILSLSLVLNTSGNVQLKFGRNSK